MSAPITSIAINAMGGHGGGVLADWIARTAEAAGYLAQVTSVPGFAQRSGATIYYVELHPKREGEPDPVFALMAVPGDADVVIASELAEGGRAVLRGFVTGKTMLISSSHREYTTEEKLSRYDGRRDSAVVFAGCDRAARSFVSFDMREAANRSACSISAVLFGALAGSGALPFEAEEFRATIRRSGMAVTANLRGFETGHAHAVAGTRQLPTGYRHGPSKLLQLTSSPTVPGEFPAPAAAIVQQAIARLTEYQGSAYARSYIDRVNRILAIDSGARNYRLTCEVARLLALQMAREDVIRVADLKTRRRRFAEVERENQLDPADFWDVAEYLAPRSIEIAELLPAPLGRVLAGSTAACRILDRIFEGGVTVRTSRLPGFLLLYAIGRLRWVRRYSLGQRIQDARIEAWLDEIIASSGDPDFAFETAGLLNLVRGYGSTFERGAKQYATIASVLAALRLRPDGAHRLALLREAALLDEDGTALDALIAELALQREAA